MRRTQLQVHHREGPGPGFGEDFRQGDSPEICHFENVAARIYPRQVRLDFVHKRANDHSFIPRDYSPGFVPLFNMIPQVLKPLAFDQQLVAENDLDVVSSNPQIVKLASVRDDMPFRLLGIVRRSKATNNPIHRDNVKNIEVFDDGRGMCLECGLIYFPARDMRVGGLE